MGKMKTFTYISGLLLFLISSVSCNNDFLSENQKSSYTLNDTLYLNNSQDNVETSILFPAKNNSDYTIFMQPKWLSFNSIHGKVVNGVLPISFSILKEKINTGYNTTYGNVVIDINDVGLLSFVVAYYDFGTPTLQCSTSSLNFDSSNNLTFTISNISDGFLLWNITGLPDWLTLSSTSGELGPGNSVSISAILNPEKINSGQELTGTLQINSNSGSTPFNIALHVPAIATIPMADTKITGIVTDAEYNQTKGIMAICTKSPNSLILYNTSSKTFNTIGLNMTPNCISMSEDGHKAVIGYSVAYVSYIDLDNSQIIKDYAINCIPFDIVLGDNFWCYIAPATGQNTDLVNLNLDSGQLVSCNSLNRMYEKTIIKKVPGQPFMKGTCTALSPSGVETYDISKGIANDTIGHYHVDAYNLWISKDATKVYTQAKKVYLFLKHDILYHFDNPSIYGQIETSMNYISGFDECQAINSFFITYYGIYSPTGYPGVIEQFNTTNLNLIKSYTLSSVSTDGSPTKYLTDAKYIFVNKEGSELYAVKNLKTNYNKDFWTIEKFVIGSK
jgi:hypothetical protein